MIAARLQAETREQRGGIECSQMLVTGTAAASLQFVGSKKAHVSADARGAECCLGRFHHLALAGGHAQQHRTQNCLG